MKLGKAGGRGQMQMQMQQMQRRVSSRGVIMVAGQRIGVGIGHVCETVTVTAEGDRFHVHNDEGLLVEVARTTLKPIARFNARKPEPSRKTTSTPKRETLTR